MFHDARHARRLAFAHRLLVRAVDVRPQETAALLLGFAYFFCLLCAYYLLRPLRDAMGLVGGAGQLQWLFTATFVAMLALVPVFGAIAARWPPRRFVPFVYRFFALNILVFAALFGAGVQELVVSRVFFVWLSVFNLFVISIFWSVMADHFSSEQGKRLFGFIAAGGTAGALAGPALAAGLSLSLGIPFLAVIAALLLEAAVRSYRRLADEARAPTERQEAARGTDPHGTRLGGGMFAGISLILRERYLLGIVLYLLLHATASTFLYFQQGRIVEVSFADTAARTRFFAVVDLAVSALALLLQMFVAGRLIRCAGIAVALMLLPLTGLLAFSALAVWPFVAVLGAVQVLRRGLDYAIVRPAREALFTVVGRAAKYKAKNVIDTVVYRGGDAASGWLFAGLAATGIGFAGMTAVFAPFGALWVWLSVWLARRQDARARASDNGFQEREASHEGRIA
ncbi:MAG TPA: MFS transporter [Noviherbaspirillum sp.]|uniref:NTP/NDP exchange transporter n=1 Tax=Noviherbaspirillum sp. TaxID=1926288 RepID=UPI002F92F860